MEPLEVRDKFNAAQENVEEHYPSAIMVDLPGDLLVEIFMELETYHQHRLRRYVRVLTS